MTSLIYSNKTSKLDKPMIQQQQQHFRGGFLFSNYELLIHTEKSNQIRICGWAKCLQSGLSSGSFEVRHFLWNRNVNRILERPFEPTQHNSTNQKMYIVNYGERDTKVKHGANNIALNLGALLIGL